MKIAVLSTVFDAWEEAVCVLGYYCCFRYKYSDTVCTGLRIFPRISLEQVCRTKTDGSKDNMC